MRGQSKGGVVTNNTPPNNQKDIETFFITLVNKLLDVSTNVPSDKALGEISKELGYRLAKLSNVKTYGSNTNLHHPFSFDVLFKRDGLDDYVNSLLTEYHTSLVLEMKNVAVYTERNRYFKRSIIETIGKGSKNVRIQNKFEIHHSCDRRHSCSCHR